MKNKCENCGECCLRTEMLLSKSDIKRITKRYPNKLEKKDFVIKNQHGFFQLKNIDEHCIFFEVQSKHCKIYKFRPRGCRFYPLIFNFQNNNCIYDDDCPRPHLFYQNRTKLKKVCQKLSRFLEVELRIK
ncbi:MAG: YkgJ family cysteine cluster protein [Promethearchaeota archaeon]